MNEECSFCENLVLDGERLDETGFGGLRLIQKPEEFCYGVDAVILADFAAKCAGAGRLTGNESVTAVDLGTGTGIIPLILSHKTVWRSITGIEVQQASFERAQRNIKLNSVEARIRFVNGDVKDFEEGWGADMKGSCNVVTSNPPYTESSGGLLSSNRAKAIARHETTAKLEDFIKCAAWLLKAKGDFFMVHRPSRLVDICCYGREYGLEPKELCFVTPTRMSPANILLVHFVKGGGRQLTMLEPIVVYNEDGTYTDQLRECYK